MAIPSAALSHSGTCWTLAPSSRATDAYAPWVPAVTPTTRRPRSASHPGPAASTVPAAAIPITKGGSNLSRPYRPRMVSTSLKSRQNASTSILTWPADGSPTSTVWISRASVGAPKRVTIHAVAVLAVIGTLRSRPAGA